MERHLLAQLQSWKNSDQRKPLILRGARQVGKTWLLQEFGKRCFKDCIYIRLEDNDAMTQLFAGSLAPNRLLEGIAAYAKRPLTPDTLLILDEAQAVPRALTACKYFYEEMPEVAVALAGSLLGVALNQGISFPVGKVTFLDLHPLSFTEFLAAMNEKALANYILAHDHDMLTVFRERLIDLLRQYHFVGGMPEAVAAFAANGDFRQVRKIHSDILIAYENDFAKHFPPLVAERCRLLWRSLPRQLAKENKKFIFTVAKAGARGRDFAEAVQILEDSGVITRVCRVAKPGLPLAAYRDESAFKLYALDVGLLAAMSGLDSDVILDGNRLFTEFKGALAEQYVCQQLLADCGIKPDYWSAERSDGEVDFLFEKDGHIVPVEVKAEENLRSKSLAAFSKAHAIPRAIRLSLADYREESWMTNVPLYAVPVIAALPPAPPVSASPPRP
ncbi:MAG: ATP-binding protein [Azoarcus sp.]|jgi:predicted AAA+ superfamily ATPase|nr:ATP-binding protein [Azoarcus sp.]